MEKFKENLFKKEYNINFPPYFKVRGEKCNEIKYQIIQKYKLIEADFESSLRGKQLFFNLINAEDENFKFFDVLKNLQIKAENHLYINWDNFQMIDEFRSEDFYKYFDDIWFPSADDIDIFDSQINWIISIRHDGAIFYIKTQKINYMKEYICKVCGYDNPTYIICPCCGCESDNEDYTIESAKDYKQK